MKINISTKKNFIIIATILLAFLFNLSTAVAEEKENITFGSFLKFTSGIITAFMIHESAHAFTADLNDIDLEWHTGIYNQPIGFKMKSDISDISDSDGRSLYSSGLISQIIGSEVILRSKNTDKNSAYIRGIMAWNIINPILYSLDYWFIGHANKEAGDRFHGDIAGIERYSSDSTADVFAFAMAGLALYQGSRYLKTQTWASDWFEGESHRLSFGPQPSGKIGLNYKLWF